MKRKIFGCLSGFLILMFLMGCGSSGQYAGNDPLIFSTKTINGRSYSNYDFKDAKVVMVNFWEPWCGPCVGELPELAKLYDDYKDEGLLVIGVYSTFDMDEDAKELVNNAQIKYPVVKTTAELEAYCSEYVPTTVFFDGQGNLLSEEPIIGSNDYAGWESIIKEYLN